MRDDHLVDKAKLMGSKVVVEVVLLRGSDDSGAALEYRTCRQRLGDAR